MCIIWLAHGYVLEMATQRFELDIHRLSGSRDRKIDRRKWIR